MVQISNFAIEFGPNTGNGGAQLCLHPIATGFANDVGPPALQCR